MGVGRSGAADRGAYRLGARNAGHGEDRAALEVLLGGLAVRALGRMTVVVTGAPAPTSLRRAAVAHADARRRDGRVGPRPSGCRPAVCAPTSPSGAASTSNPCSARGRRTPFSLRRAGAATPRRRPARGGSGGRLPHRRPRGPCRRPPAQVSPCSRCCPGRERRGSAGGAVTWAGCWDWCGTSPATATGWAFASVVPVSGGSRRGAVSSFPARGWSGVRAGPRPAGSRWCSSPTTR